MIVRLPSGLRCRVYALGQGLYTYTPITKAGTPDTRWGSWSGPWVVGATVEPPQPAHTKET